MLRVNNEKLKYMKLYLLIYLICFSLIILSHTIYPTDLAGPGLDLLVYSFVLLYSLLNLTKNLFEILIQKKAYQYRVMAHALGLTFMISLLFIH